MINPSFLKFCLWLLSDSQKYFTIKNRKGVCSKLQRYILSKLSYSEYKELNLPYIVEQYPALKVEVTHDEIGLKFFQEIMKPFHSKLSLTTGYTKTVGWIFSIIPSVVSSIKYLQTGEGLSIGTSGDDFANVLCFASTGLDALSTILKRSRYHSIYVSSSFHTTSEILYLLPPSIQSNAKSLYLAGIAPWSEGDQKKIQMATKFSLSPDIKTLCLVDQNFDQNTVSILGQMMEKGNLSHLSKLSFNRCTGLKTMIALVSSLSQLSELCLYRCKLDSADYIALSSAIVSKKLPMLDTIILPIHNDERPARTLVKYAYLNVRMFKCF